MGIALVMHARILARTNTPMRTLTRWAERAGATEPAMEEVVQYMEMRESELFESEGRSAGRPWAEHAPETNISRARRHEDSGKILEASGRLKDSLTEQTEDSIREIGPGFVRFGTRVPYADILAKGWNTEHQHVPARRPIDFSNSRDRYAILKIFKSFLTGRATIAPSIKLSSVRRFP
jgi:phage gpG-like protein